MYTLVCILFVSPSGRAFALLTGLFVGGKQVKHFLLIGCLGMFIGACVFLWFSVSRPKSSLPHVLIFMASAISCMSFYAMWTGIGVE